jgi:hypothetical protein
VRWVFPLLLAACKFDHSVVPGDGGPTDVIDADIDAR